MNGTKLDAVGLLDRHDEHTRRLDDADRWRADIDHRIELLENGQAQLQAGQAQLHKTLIKRMALEAQTAKRFDAMHADIKKLLRRRDG